jgi:hypothetical protein
MNFVPGSNQICSFTAKVVVEVAKDAASTKDGGEAI